MKFNKSLLSFLFLTTTAFAAHTSSRKVFATDIVNKSGTSVFYFPTSLPLASRACIMNSDREITSSSVTDTELGYLSGVTSAIQTQLNAKYSGLPSQTGNSGKYLTTNGTSESWATVSAGISALTGDVTASGTGSVAATVASVGGKTASQVGTSVDDTVAATSANTASVIVKRDSSKNFLINNIGTTTTSTTTSNNATLTLTVASSKRQRLGGTGTNYKVKLPDATTLGQAGFPFVIDNRSSQDVSVIDNGSNVLYTVAAGTETTVTATSIASANGTWEVQTAVGQPASDSASGYLSAADHASYTTTGTAVSARTSTNTASAIAARSSDGNLWINGAFQKSTSTATAAGTTTLTVASSPIQIWTGATTQTIKMPAANTLVQVGTTYKFINQSSGALTIQDNSAGAITTIAAGGSADIVVTNIGSAAGTWIANSASPALTNTQIGFGASSVLSSSSKFTWDDTNQVLKIGSTGTAKIKRATLDWMTNDGANAYYYNPNAGFYLNMTSDGIVANSTASNYTSEFLMGGGFGAIGVAKTSGSTLNSTTKSVVKLDGTSAAFTTTLPSASTGVATGLDGAIYEFTKIDATNNITKVDANSTQTIGADLDSDLGAVGDSIKIWLDGTNTKWQYLSDSRAPKVYSITTNTTLTAQNRNIIVLCDATSGNVTTTGYSVAGKSGWKVILKKIDASGNSCIYTAASGSGDGASVTLTTQNSGKEIVTNGTNSYIIGSF